ncbi:MAG: protein translocase subunit SecF [Patescibacteria group bacterium]
MKLDVIRYRFVTFAISGIVVGLSVLILLVFGLKPGIDFTGGSLLEVSFAGERPSLSHVQDAVAGVPVGAVLVQPVDEDSMILKTRFITEAEHQELLLALRTAFETENRKVYEDRLETIGPAVSANLRERAIWAGIMVILGIVAYIAYSFRHVSLPVQSWKYGVVSIVALIHNIVTVAGVFALLGHFKGVEVDIQFMVALLTILGYSVNDTIVVFDRIRENLIRHGRGNFAEVVNYGVNETLMRSLNISFAILLVLLALFFFGGTTIHYFSLALIIGTLVGSYTSIFFAAPLLAAWESWGRRRRV